MKQVRFLRYVSIKLIEILIEKQLIQFYLKRRDFDVLYMNEN